MINHGKETVKEMMTIYPESIVPGSIVNVRPIGLDRRHSSLFTTQNPDDPDRTGCIIRRGHRYIVLAVVPSKFVLSIKFNWCMLLTFGPSVNHQSEVGWIEEYNVELAPEFLAPVTHP
jgi:hypothetical protein